MELGDRVVDVEDDEPDTAIVLRAEEGETISDWTHESEGEEVTAAEMNPEYPVDEQLVMITFEEDLDERWPEWREGEPEEYWEGVIANSVSVYGFPEGRLGHAEPPSQLEEVIERLEGSVDKLEWKPSESHLAVEKLGDSYTISPDGAVEGAGPYAERFAEIVDERLSG